MKRGIVSIFLIALFLSCYTQAPEKYVPKTARKRVRCATAEPGTYLKPPALSLLKRMNRVMEDSTVKAPAPWVIEIFTKHQKRLLDTVLVFNELEVPVRIYYPTKRSLQGQQPAILFFHGGGFILGSVEQYHVMASKMARVTGQIIISVDYRLAPEHPFPAAVNDCFSVFQWMQQFGSTLGVDTARISVAGDSAGGNLATVLTLVCRDEHVPQPYRQVLLYPALTFVETEYPSMTYFLKDPDRRYVLSESFLRRAKTAYLGSEGTDLNPYISPMEAKLTGDLAPALIIAAECDPLRDVEREYAEKLKAAGVEVKYLEYSGMIHAFMSFHMILEEALDAMKEVRVYLGEN